ncbi:hypothetical protein [Thaumasiovibrio subtropicus]|uniref:hypothetical protein n=1 Tax=Thaumasiovibrio subtropicus TaxID=1891207 RepID=UPI000B359E7A|nr:hypothetical protein [Thaumasiovibrio subtropicus]
MKKLIPLMALAPLALIGCSGGDSGGGGGGSAPITYYTFNFVEQYSTLESNASSCMTFGYDEVKSTDTVKHVVVARKPTLVEGLEVVALDANGAFLSRYAIPSGGVVKVPVNSVPADGYLGFIDSQGSSVSGKGDVFVQVFHKDFIGDINQGMFNVIKEQGNGNCLGGASVIPNTQPRFAHLSASQLGVVPTAYRASSTLELGDKSAFAADIPVTAVVNQSVLGTALTEQDGKETLVGYTLVKYNQLTDSQGGGTNVDLSGDVFPVNWTVTETDFDSAPTSTITVRSGSNYYPWMQMPGEDHRYAYPSTNDTPINTVDWFASTEGVSGGWNFVQNTRMASPGNGHNLSLLVTKPSNTALQSNQSCAIGATNLCVELRGSMTVNDFDVQRTFVRARSSNNQADIWLSVYAPPADRQLIPSTGNTDFDAAFSGGTILRQEASLAKVTANTLPLFIASFGDASKTVNNNHEEPQHESKAYLRNPATASADRATVASHTYVQLSLSTSN